MGGNHSEKNEAIAARERSRSELTWLLLRIAALIVPAIIGGFVGVIALPYFSDVGKTDTVVHAGSGGLIGFLCGLMIYGLIVKKERHL